MGLPCKCETLATFTYLLAINSVYLFVQQATNESSKHHQVKGQGPRLLANCQKFGDRVTNEGPPVLYSLTKKQHREFTKGRCWS